MAEYEWQSPMTGLGTKTALAPVVPPDRFVVLPSITWETYKRISAETPPGSGVRLTYDDQSLQIMALSAGHESTNRDLAELVVEMSVLLDLPIWQSGSTTFNREDLKKGFEPDSSFYIETAERMLGKTEIDLSQDPPPDLVVEVDITRKSMNKLPLFAAVGIPEVWRFDGDKLHILVLDGDGYRDARESSALAPLTAEAVTDLLRLRQQQPLQSAWRKAVRQWFDSLPARE